MDEKKSDRLLIRILTSILYYIAVIVMWVIIIACAICVAYVLINYPVAEDLSGLSLLGG